MIISQRSAYKSVVAISLAIAGAGLMTRFDQGGIVWLKFVLYLVTFGAGSFVALFPPATKCGLPVWHRPKKS